MNSKLGLGLALTLAFTSSVCAQDQPVATAVATATCGAQTIGDQCRVTWTFDRPPGGFYWVQQLNPMTGMWQSVAHEPDGTAARGSRDAPVEAGNLYRVLACEDAKAATGCQGSTMVWAPFIQPPGQEYLIPSLVPAIHPDRSWGGYAGSISKDAGWLSQVIQYNVIQMTNAISYAKIAELPDMTPVRDIRSMSASESTPIDEIQFNVWAFFQGERGTPLEMPTPPPRQRAPHEHPERQPQ